MIAQQVERNVLRSNVQNEHAFTIKATAKTFQILSNALYSDKPLAVVRELVCNAVDSHVAAGKRDVPVEVNLPSRINPTLSIKDFGTGLDHDGIINVYTKFFESTKTESNDFVGQLGLGSKAPFSMFNTFSVEARHNGTKRVYTAYTNEDGIPTIAQMGESTTDEQNGLTVSMSVKPDDFDKFHNAAKRALMYVTPKPIVNGAEGFVVYEVKHGLSGTNWKMRESDYWAKMSGPAVVQGSVVYPIDGNIIKEAGLSPAAQVIASLNVDFWMNIGSVEVAPSREQLSYTKSTIANCAAQFELVASEMVSVIQADFDSATTMAEAGIKLHKYESVGDWQMRNLFEKMNNAQPFTWNGTKVTYKHKLDTLAINSTNVLRAQIQNHNKLNFSSRYAPVTVAIAREVPITDLTSVLIDDIYRGTNSVVRQYINATAGVSNVIILKADKKALHDQAEIDSIVVMLGNPVVQKLSALPFKPIAATYSGGRSKESRLQFSGFPQEKGYRHSSGSVRRVFSRLTWDAVDCDLEDGGFFVPLDRFNVMHDGRVVEYYDELIEAAKTLGILTDDDLKSTYGFSDKEAALVKDDDSWVNLFDYLKEQFIALDVVDKIVDAQSIQALNNEMDTFNKFFGSSWYTHESKVNDGAFKTFINDTRKVVASGKMEVIYLAHAKRFMALLGLSGDIDKRVSQKSTKMISAWTTLLNKHEMLSVIDWYSVRDTKATVIINYINALAVQ
jgi:hypothetical protein